MEGTNHRDQNEITPMHAAAVNGDKSSLAKLIVGKFIGCNDKQNS